MDNNVTFQINIAGNVFAGVGTLHGDFTQLIQTVGHVDKSINHTFNNLRDKIQNINLNAIISQVQHVGQGLADLAKPGIGFGQEMADLSSITGIAGSELRDLGKTARAVSKESGLSAAEAAKAFSLLASQIDIDSIGIDGLKELQRNTVLLSQAAGMNMDASANALAGTINQYGFAASEANRVINVLAAGSKFGAAEIGDLAQSFKDVGSQASIAGVSLEETAGALEILAKNGLKGSEAGTDLRNIILSLQTVFGADLTKMSLSQALEQLKPKFEDAEFMAKSFGRASMASAQFLVKYSSDIKEMTASVTGTQTAQEQAAIRTETVGMMVERCRAKVNSLKIGIINITGSFGGYATVLVEQVVTISQLLPLFSLLSKGIGFVTSATKLQAIWAGISSTATAIWTGVQWAFNVSLWACPITWIVVGVMALIAAIVICVTKVQGWGKQWDSIVKFMKAGFVLYVETIKFQFNTMVDGIMIGLDYIKLGWYKFKEACGMGDSNANREMIAKISGDIEARKQSIVEGAQRIKSLAVEASNALTWELSWKKSDKTESSKATGTAGLSTTPAINSDGGGGGTLDLSGKGGKGRSSQEGLLDLNKIIPDLKGSTAYSAITSKLAPVRAASIAAAASVALPLTMAATTLPGVTGDPLSPANTEYMAAESGKSITMTKFCDQIVIHVANTDGKGRDQIRTEVMAVMEEMLDDFA